MVFVRTLLVHLLYNSALPLQFHASSHDAAASVSVSADRNAHYRYP